MLAHIIVFSFAFMVAFLTTPVIRAFGVKLYIIDHKSSRKMHKKIITKLGGLAIYLGFLAAVLAAFLLRAEQLIPYIPTFLSIFVGANIILLLGIYDDVKGANANVKFSAQAIVALFLIKSGFIISLDAISFISASSPLLNQIFTFFWIVGIINAINLIDGLDGLAAGVAFIVLVGIFLNIALFGGSTLIYFLSIALSGAVLGFLKYNFYPARIFMGDTGSLFLGFMLAIMAIKADAAVVANPRLFISVLIGLLFPIIDTVLAILRRITRNKNIFNADISHIHHWLVKKGLSQTEAVLSLYIVTLFLVILSFLYIKLV